MSHAADKLLDLLQEERTAAREANLGHLEALQDRKREVMADLADNPATDFQREALAELAHDNISLMRHLTHMLQGMVGIASGATYGSNGEAGGVDIKTDRGVL